MVRSLISYVQPGSADIFRALPFINDVLVFDKKGEHRKLKALWKLGKKLKQKNYHRLFSPHRSFRTSLLVLLSGVRERPALTLLQCAGYTKIL